MKKKFLIVFVLVIICIIIFFNGYTFASIVNTNRTILPTYTHQFDDFGSTILSTIRTIGMIISIGALMVIGIKYMLSSVEERAEKKQSMIYYCIGAFLVFSIVNIVSAVYNWAYTL